MVQGGITGQRIVPARARPRCQAEGGQAEPIGAAWPTTTDELAQVSDNDAEELLPVAAFEKVIKTTITQAASPVTREDMGTAYKSAIPGATVTVSPGAPCRGRAGAP